MFENFIQSEIDEINSEAAWTDDQQKVFNSLISGKWNDEGIMSKFGLSRNKYYKIKL